MSQRSVLCTTVASGYQAQPISQLFLSSGLHLGPGFGTYPIDGSATALQQHSGGRAKLVSREFGTELVIKPVRESGPVFLIPVENLERRFESVARRTHVSQYG